MCPQVVRIVGWTVQLVICIADVLPICKVVVLFCKLPRDLYLTLEVLDFDLARPLLPAFKALNCRQYYTCRLSAGSPWPITSYNLYL